MKMKKINLVWGMMAACAVLNLTGCASGVMSEEDIEDEVQAKLQADVAEDMEITSFTVDERKTDTENKKDDVFVTVEAQNDTASIERHYWVNLYKYDEGWSVEGIYDNLEDEWLTVPLKEPDESLVSEEIDTQIVDSEFMPEEMKAVYYSTETVEHNNWTDNITYATTFVFDDDDLEWKRSDREIAEDDREWNIEGTWEVKDKGFAAMGGSCVSNDNYVARADVTVEDDTAYVHIYAYGEKPEYFNQDNTYEIDLSQIQTEYKTEDMDFTEKVPGFMAITVNSCFFFNSDNVALDKLYVMEKIG